MKVATSAEITSAVAKASALSQLTHDLTFGPPEVRERAARQLTECGGEAVGVLANLGIQDSDRGVRIAAAISLLALAPAFSITFPDAKRPDPELDVLQAVIKARSHGGDGVPELRSALNHRDRNRRDTAVTALELLLRAFSDEEQRRPFTYLLIESIDHKHRDVRTRVLGLLQRIEVHGSVPALLSRLRRVSRIATNREGTVSGGSILAFMALSLSKFAPPPINSLHGVFETQAWIPIALLTASLVFFPLSLAFRLRGKLLAASPELMEVMRALDRQELALADGALKDLRSIASIASGHSSELRDGARELIQRIEDAKGQHGPLPIPAGASDHRAASLPVSGASE